MIARACYPPAGVSERVVIREWCEGDGVAEVTRLLNAAYARLRDMGFRYTATWQGDDVTRDRMNKGRCFVAIEGGALVGTLTLYFPASHLGAEYYHREGVAVFGQFAVQPSRQGRGIGSALLSHAEATALSLGATEMALDTAEGASHLIELYTRRGYAVVSRVDWPDTNYVSVILAKRLTP